MPSLVRWRRLALIGAALAPGPATAATGAPVSVVVGGAGACPQREAVVRALAVLLPEMHVAADDRAAAQAGTAIAVGVSDEGQRYRVRVGETDRVLSDPARRCDDRARAAAVVIALVVNPPAAAPDETTTANEPPARAAPAP